VNTKALLSFVVCVVAFGSAAPSLSTPLGSAPLRAGPLEGTSIESRDDDGGKIARRRRKARKRGKKAKVPAPAPEPAPPPPPPPPPPPKGPRLLVFPPVVEGGDPALASAVRAAVIAEVKTLHGAEKLHFEGGVEKVAAVEKALGSLLASCQAQTSCLVEQGQAAEAAFVLALRVAGVGAARTIDVALVDVGQASLDASYSRSLATEQDTAQEVSATARLALRRFLDEDAGTLTLIVTEPGANVRVGGGRDVEVVLEPTPELLESRAFGRTLWAALAWSTVGVGVVTALGGGGLVGWNTLRAGEVSQAIADANAEHRRRRMR